MQQMVPGGALSASLWSRNVADGVGSRERYYLRHFGHEMMQMMSADALSVSL